MDNLDPRIAALAALFPNASADPAAAAPAEPTRVILSNLTVLKATEGGERWLEGYSADLNANVRLNQDAIDALEAADYVRPGEPKPVSDKLMKLPLRGAVVEAEVGPVRLNEIEGGKVKREATMKKFIEVRKTSVTVSKWAF